jgi:ribosomal protein S12 methylthiotransferase accessory factor
LSGQRSKAEIRFSSNFSVYVLPPDGVCLYAENRKVFLRGQLYCAIALHIGAAERLLCAPGGKKNLTQ